MLKKILLCVCANAIFIEPVCAYLDGGTGGMLLQLLFGGVTGIVIIIKMYWQSFVIFFKGNKKNVCNVEKMNDEGKKAVDKDVEQG